MDELFGPEDDCLSDTGPKVVAAPQRASEHEHFVSCRGIWSLGDDGPASQLDHLHKLRQYSVANVERISTELRGSRTTYGSSCAKALRASRCAYEAAFKPVFDGSEQVLASNETSTANIELLLQEARTCVDFCAAELDEANWSASCWQEANALALAYQIAARLSEAQVAPECRDSSSVDPPSAKLPKLADSDDADPRNDDDGHDVGANCVGVKRNLDASNSAETVGKLAIALFNLAVTMCTPPASPSAEWRCLVSSLLHAVEIVVNSAPWLPQPRRPCVELSEAMWRVPTEIPPWRKPSLRGPQIASVSADELSTVDFFNLYLRPGKPLVIRGLLAAQGWAALDYFSDLRRLHAEHGERLVPLTLGSPIVAYGGPRHWPLRRLIEQHLLPSTQSNNRPKTAADEVTQPDEESDCEVAYMNQHHFLHQCPELQDLITMLPYTLGRPLLPTNVWLGTRGTVTSLHSDPNDNLLCHVAGFKYVRLYGLDQTQYLYATMLREKNNNSFGTSPVRVEAPDEAAYPDFSKASYEETLLAPGDVLFLPKSVWHYVRGLSTSCSINFWFG